MALCKQIFTPTNTQNSPIGCKWDNSRRQLGLFFEERESIVHLQRVVLLLGRWGWGWCQWRLREQKVLDATDQFLVSFGQAALCEVSRVHHTLFQLCFPFATPFLYLVQMCPFPQTAKSSSGLNCTRLPREGVFEQWFNPNSTVYTRKRPQKSISNWNPTNQVKGKGQTYLQKPCNWFFHFFF